MKLVGADPNVQRQVDNRLFHFDYMNIFNIIDRRNHQWSLLVILVTRCFSTWWSVALPSLANENPGFDPISSTSKHPPDLLDRDISKTVKINSNFGHRSCSEYLRRDYQKEQ
ncbi:hypothetical protein RB195_020350 [Necator americanus]|uniref:Uncharacterized protein n=1 Tax=Necator americanus TaxID=51031 RepID=A0ABR1CKJ5_NECAM